MKEINETLKKEIIALLNSIDNIEFHLELINDNEDTYDPKIEWELTEEYNKLYSQFSELTENLPKNLLDDFITQYYKQFW